MEFWKKHWHNLIGGALGSVLSLGISSTYQSNDVVLIISVLVGIFAGVLIAQNIHFLVYVRRCWRVAKKDKGLLDRAAKKGKTIYHIEKKIMEHHHQVFEERFEEIFRGGIEMSFSDYEKLIGIFIEAVEELRLPLLRLRGTCLILPSNFDTSSEYVYMWLRIHDEYLKKTSPELMRILCNHRKVNLLQAISSYPKRFKDFCEWNKETDFQLYLYKGDYDLWRTSEQLPINDFGIVNNITVIGGVVSENEKLALTPEMFISKTQVRYDTRHFDDFLDRILRDRRCMQIDMAQNVDEIYDDCLRFLREG